MVTYRFSGANNRGVCFSHLAGVPSSRDSSYPLSLAPPRNISLAWLKPQEPIRRRRRAKFMDDEEKKCSASNNSACQRAETARTHVHTRIETSAVRHSWYNLTTRLGHVVTWRRDTVKPPVKFPTRYFGMRCDVPHIYPRLKPALRNSRRSLAFLAFIEPPSPFSFHIHLKWQGYSKSFYCPKMNSPSLRIYIYITNEIHALNNIY